MLFLVTLFASLFLVRSQDAPSAHLQGGVPQATEYTVNQVITAWNPADPESHVMNGFEYADGVLHVPRDGRYHVYAQMYFNSRPHATANRVVLVTDNRTLLLIHRDMTANQENTGSANGVFRLRAGERIFVKVVGYPTKLWVGPSHCHFGAYLI